jgi:hypothetical protein
MQTPAVVVDRHHGVTPLPSENDANPFARLVRDRVLVGGVRNELVEGVLGILIGLAADEHSPGEAPDA